jgi:cell pole-organizing protein PopZ
MKKDLEMSEPKITETLQEHAEGDMEEILASIRKIMDPNPQVSTPSPPQSSTSTSSLDSPQGTIVADKKHSEDVLVLTRKIAPKSSDIKENRSQKSEKESFSPHVSKPEGKSSLESLVSSSLTPLIQVWLEKNLPNIVEKVVKEEIKKLLDPNSKSIK